jgi:hypothetical protein
MIYLKINEKIRELLDLVKDNFKLGCKYYCSKQIIALDEFELMRKELILKNIKKFTDEEFKQLISSTESFYLHNTHLCQSQEPESEDESKLLDELKKDKINPTKKIEYFETMKYNEFEEEYSRKKKEEEESMKSINSKSEFSKIRSESSISYAFSMVGSLFLLSLGSYYLGKYFFNMSEPNTYKLVLVITIIVLISEMVLLVLKMNKESEKTLTPKKIKESSFAYKFNKKYRDQCNINEKKKLKTCNNVFIKSKTE